MSLENYRGSMLSCSKCSYCKFIPLAKINGLKYADGCPSITNYGFHTFSGGGRLTAALSLLENRSDYTEKIKDMVYQCQLCGSCDVTCKVCRYDMELQTILEEIRAKFVEDAQTLKVHDDTIENLRRENNMMQVMNAGRGDWANGLEMKDLTKEKGETLFFAGCRCSFDEDMKKIARTAVSVLQAGGINLGVMGDAEFCCGGAAYNLGYRRDYLRQAHANIKAWKEAGVKTIVTPCAACYWALNWLYRQIDGFDIEALHTVQLVSRLVSNGSLKLSKPLTLKVTYHDPCRLGRLGKPYEKWEGSTTKIFGTITKNDPPKPRYNGSSGVYDEPRELLKAIPGISIVEMTRSREASWCCGAGGGVYKAFPDFSIKTAKSRLEEAVDTGAEVLASACPMCERNFSDAISAGGESLKVYDVLELILMAI